MHCWADFWQRTLALRLHPICNAVTSPSPYLLDVAEALICECGLGSHPCADPVLHQNPVFYEGSGENSCGNWDTGIGLDVRS